VYLKILHLIVFFFIKSSFFINFETKTPHRFNFKRRTAVGKLFSKSFIVSSVALVPHNFKAPYLVQKFTAAYRPVFVFGKVIEQIEFRAGKSDVFPVKFSLFFIDIYDNISILISRTESLCILSSSILLNMLFILAMSSMGLKGFVR